MPDHIVSPHAASVPVAERLTGCQPVASACNTNIMNYAVVPSNGTVTRTLPPNPYCPGTIRADAYDRVVDSLARSGLETPLIPMARRSGLEAVARAYDAGMSVPVLAL